MSFQKNVYERLAKFGKKRNNLLKNCVSKLKDSAEISTKSDEDILIEEPNDLQNGTAIVKKEKQNTTIMHLEKTKTINSRDADQDTEHKKKRKIDNSINKKEKKSKINELQNNEVTEILNENKKLFKIDNSINKKEKESKINELQNNEVTEILNENKKLFKIDNSINKKENKSKINELQNNEVTEILNENKKLFKIDLLVIKKEDLEHFIAVNYEDIYNESQMYAESVESLNSSFYKFDVLSNETKNWLVAIDCEMVKTENGTEIGRITILEHNGNVLYDKIIKPTSKITDYLTQYSGLTESSYEDAISYEQMKNEIQKIIGANTVILGHSLHNDLNILKIHHKKLIDTSFLYRCKDNRRVSLKNLAYKFLGKQIQKNMHCSLEDATVCLELLALKIMEKHDYDSAEIKIDYGCEIRKCCINEYERYKNKKGINYFLCTKDEYEKQNITNNYKTRFYMVFYKEKNKIKFLL